MLLAGLLLTAAVSAPLAPQADAFVTAFEAGDVPRMMQLWSAQSPSRNAGRQRLAALVVDGLHVRFTALTDEQRGVLCLDLYDAKHLLEQYELHFRREDGQWRAWSLTAAAAVMPLPRGRELLHRAKAHLDAGAIGEAGTAATRGAELAAISGHAPTRSWAERSLGAVAFRQGDAETARRHYERALDLARAAGDSHATGRALESLASIDIVTGGYERAESRYREALSLFHASRHPALAANMVSGLGRVAGVRGDQQGALDRFRDALAVFEDLGDLDGTSRMLHNVAVTLRNLGHYREAAAALERELELSRALGDVEGVAYALSGLGSVLEMDGRPAEAMAALQEGVALFERLGRADAVSLELSNLGSLYRVLGNLDQAREHYQRALALAEKIGYRAAVAGALRNLAEVRLSQGDARGARQLHERVLAVANELGNRAGVVLALNDLGHVHLHEGNRAAARDFFARSFAVAEEITDREMMLSALGMQSQVADDPQEAIALAGRALEMATALDMRDRIWQSHLDLGRAYRRAGRLAEARTHVAQSLAIVEELRAGLPGEEVARQQAFATVVMPYEEMVRVLVEQGDPAAALEQAERAKGRVLLEVLRNGRPDLGSVLSAEDRAREAALSATLAGLNRQQRAALVAGARPPGLAERVRKARLEYEAFLMRIHSAHPQLRAESGAIEPVRISEVYALLAGGNADAFLELVVTDERTYVFSITTAGGVHVHTIAVAKKKLESDVRRLRELLAARDVTYGPAARALYDLLLRPVAQRLRGAKTIGIVADGPLWELPFQALQSGPGEFVLDRHAVFYVPSLTVLREMNGRRRTRAGARLLAFGNPVISRETARRVREVHRGISLAPLPQSETEVRNIAALYDARTTRVLLRDDAREEVVKREAGKFDVLHFATHGVLDDQNALYSRLLFSPPSRTGEDGMLEAREIMRLDLRADLAVLSACDTARGRVSAGEGLIGMSWALFVAGVPTTVVSQWKVDSTSTAELMVEFHRELRTARRTKAEALRRAALKTRATYRHPFYWAPFVVVGSAR